jgi:hypothetical protein
MTKRQQKRFASYQVDSLKYNVGLCQGVKKVSELTEDEAKDELCDAMDLIDKLIHHNIIALELTEKARYLPRGVLT